MAIDASIYGQLQQPQPVNLLAQYGDLMNLQGAQQQQRMNALKFDAYQRDQNDVNALNRIYRDATGPDGTLDRAKLFSGVAGANLGSRIPDMQKKFIDMDKDSADIKAKKIDAANKKIAWYRDSIGMVNSPEQAAQYVRVIYNDPDLKGTAITAVPLDVLLAQTPQDAAQLEGWKQKFALGATKFMELNKPTFTTRNTGASTDTISTAGLTGATQVLNSVPNTQSPDNAATIAAADDRARLEREQRQQHFNTQQANAGNTYDAERGVVVNTREGTARQVLGQEGQPLAAKLPEAVKKELLSISQQRSVIDGALGAVRKTPSAFGMGRGLATMAGTVPESIAGRLDSKDEREARAYVFNNVSAVINERAGAAQSAQELARLRAFLPAETDNAEQITDKFEGFKKYLDDKEKGTRPASPQGGPRIPRISNDAEYTALPSGATFIGPDGKTRRKP